MPRFTTIFQKLCDRYEWHTNFIQDKLEPFQASHRPQLFQLGIGVMENLAELTTGPCRENQELIYSYIYDRYNGIMRRYTNDVESQFYGLKLQVAEYMLTMTEGFNELIVDYMTSNFDIQAINQIIVNSVKQLYCVKVKKQPAC